MRELTNHIVSGDQAVQLKIEVLDEPGVGGACHLYHITGFDSASNASDPWTARHGQSGRHSTILFQNGPIKEAGVNGITHEALLAVLIDRLYGFQEGPFACEDNAEALRTLKHAMHVLQRRTLARIARGVEGTNKE